MERVAYKTGTGHNDVTGLIAGPRPRLWRDRDGGHLIGWNQLLAEEVV